MHLGAELNTNKVVVDKNCDIWRLGTNPFPQSTTIP